LSIVQRVWYIFSRRQFLKMPIYEYLCQKCGEHLEVLQKMSDKPLSRCPKCRGKLEKMLSQTSFQLKGSGWYATDYASSSSKRSKSESESTDKNDKSKKTDTDSKSSKKGETPSSPATSVTGSGTTDK
jgi:putative FmdB family regulatory protein